MGMFSLSDVQAAIREQGVDGWLLYDFRKSNVLAERVLGLDKKPAVAGPILSLKKGLLENWYIASKRVCSTHYLATKGSILSGVSSKRGWRPW